MDEVWKILLIDDDAGIRRITALALGQAGYSVVTAADGPSGIQLCQEVAAQIVITDVGMPAWTVWKFSSGSRKSIPTRKLL